MMGNKLLSNPELSDLQKQFVALRRGKATPWSWGMVIGLLLFGVLGATFTWLAELRPCSSAVHNAALFAIVLQVVLDTGVAFGLFFASFCVAWSNAELKEPNPDRQKLWSAASKAVQRFEKLGGFRRLTVWCVRVVYWAFVAGIIACGHPYVAVWLILCTAVQKFSNVIIDRLWIDLIKLVHELPPRGWQAT